MGTMGSVSRLSNAVQFAFEMLEGTSLTPDTFKALVEKYGGRRVAEKTLVFRDNSRATWDEGASEWEIVE